MVAQIVLKAPFKNWGALRVRGSWGLQEVCQVHVKATLGA